MSEPATPVPPQVSQVPSQSFQPPAPLRSFTATPGKVTPGAWAYETAMRVFQALLGLLLIVGGGQIGFPFGRGYGSGGNGGFFQALIVLIGIALLVAGIVRPFKLR